MITLEKVSGVYKGKINGDKPKMKAWPLDKLQIANKYLQDKQKVIIVSTLTGVVIIGASIGLLHYRSNLNTVYNVIVDGQKIGTVSNTSVIQKWESQELMKAQNNWGSTVTLMPKNTITFEKEVLYKGEYNNIAAIKAFTDRLEIEAKGIEIIVDGKVVGIVRSKSTAEAILSNLKQLYLPKQEKGKVMTASVASTSQKTVELKGVNLKENITFRETDVDPKDITNEAEMLTLLQKGTLEERKYIVKKGDTLSEIAYQFGLTTKQIFQLNPQLESDLIHIGDELVVTALKPMVTVETEEKVTQIESIPYRISYRKDNSLYVNETKLFKKGQKGKKEVQYSLKKENGIIIDKEVIYENVLDEPVEQIYLKGTKITPSRGSGILSWPTNGGIITSYFGPRWGSTHNAIDIARADDLTIMAADDGEVIYAGWKGSYGKAIMIDHGNGIVTIYGHLSKIEVSVGDKVGKGQEIGVMGNTGRSTGTHLHFEVRVDGEPKNPLNYVGI